MPCPHRFAEYLQLEKLTFEPTTLIIGTFNPGWDNIGNTAQWFYGRTHDNNGNQNNNFWDVLPKLYGLPSLINSTSTQWKQFCVNQKIAITDIIANIEDADQRSANHRSMLSGYADDDIVQHFFDFDLVNLVRLLRRNSTISNVYITRSTTEAFWRNKTWDLKRYCEVNRLPVKSLLTPSGYAGIQQRKHNRANPNNQLSLPDYILTSWRAKWHETQNK